MHETPKPSLPVLTGARFFAALFVMAFHFGALSTPPPWLAPILPHGRAGVSFFFVLSGFVLAYQYLDTFVAGLHGPALARFFRARFARVYPMHGAVLLFVTPIVLWILARDPARLTGTPIGDGTLAASWLANLLLVQIYVPRTAFEQLWNGPAWSVGCEVFFYVTFPFFARVVLARLRSRSALVGLMVACHVVSVALFVAVARAIEGRHLRQPLVALDYCAYRVPFLRVWEFWSGAALGAIFVRWRPVAFARRVAREGAMLGVVVAVVVVGAMAGSGGSRALPLHWYVAYAPLFAALIGLLACGRSWLAALLGWAPVVRLGEASYSLYLVHKPILLLVRALGVDHVSPGVCAALMIGCIASSLLLFRFVEEPARRRLRGSDRGACRPDIKGLAATTG